MSKGTDPTQGAMTLKARKEAAQAEIDTIISESSGSGSSGYED